PDASPAHPRLHRLAQRPPRRPQAPPPDPTHPRPQSQPRTRSLNPANVRGQTTSRTLLLTTRDEGELVEVDLLVAGAAATGPAAQDGLEEQHRLRQCQAGRGAFGSSRSSVRKAWAQVTSAQWWWKPR